MMNNIFSVFDPSSSSPILNWVSIIMVLVILPSLFWTIPNRFTLVWDSIYTTMHFEFKLMAGPNMSTGLTAIIVSILTLILINNLCGLAPYPFTATSHMAPTLAISLSIWTGLMFYGWLNEPKYMLAHLIPQSTPLVLMPVMVLIETTSNLIRPATLAIRLTANMMAGHLLMTLLGNQVANNENMVTEPIMLLIPILLLTLEFAVAMIQSYVFSVLVTLYSSEVT